MQRSLIAAAACLAGVSVSAVAADAGWRVVVSSASSSIAIPQLPAPSHSHYVQSTALADAGTGLIGFKLRQSNGPDGLWAERGSILAPYAEVDAAGATGPGRGGAESADLFTQLDGYSDSSDGGSRVFGGRAGDPDGSSSTGLWQHAGSTNSEIARLGSDGPLGPGLGGGAFYKSFHHVDQTDYDYDARSLPHGRVLFAGRIGSENGLGDDGLSVHTPGAGNRPCMIEGSTDPDYGPGIVDATFTGISSLFAVSPQGEVYALASERVNGGSFGSGIWQFCDGAPRLAVLTGVTGEFGPGLAEDSAYFGGDNNGLRSYIAPSVAGGFYFSSGGRSSSVSGAPSFFGLFHHADGHNQPILLEDTEGALGPHIDGYIFNTSIIPYNIKAAGKYGALQTVVSPVGDTSSQDPGLWRLTPEGGAEPVAISGDTGAYAPAPGRIWNGTFYKFAVFDNGDIVTLASTKQGSTTRVSLWRLRRGEAPVEILKPGDLVKVPTTSGIVDLPVTDIDAQYLIALPPPAGRDTWFSANGEVLLDVDIEGYGATTTLIRGIAAAPNLIFNGTFD